MVSIPAKQGIQIYKSFRISKVKRPSAGTVHLPDLFQEELHRVYCWVSIGRLHDDLMSAIRNVCDRVSSNAGIWMYLHPICFYIGLTRGWGFSSSLGLSGVYHIDYLTIVYSAWGKGSIRLLNSLEMCNQGFGRFIPKRYMLRGFIRNLGIVTWCSVRKLTVALCHSLGHFSAHVWVWARAVECNWSPLLNFNFSFEDLVLLSLLL